MRWLPADSTAWRTLAVSAGFELGLGGLAFLIGWVIGIEVLDGVIPTWNTFAAGIAATVPMIAILFVLLRWPPGSFKELENRMRQWVRVLIAPTGVFGLLLISVAAGIGEELLTRGLIHTWLLLHSPPSVALCLTAVIFGLMHPVSRIYIVMAAIVGAYLGWVWMACDKNLVAPAVAHAFYDFVALLVLSKGGKQSSARP
jgi:membrane protease YdiL (CAAX protease family)